MSHLPPGLSFYPEDDVEYCVRDRQPGQLELLFRTCRLASLEGLTQLQLVRDSAGASARDNYHLLADENLAARLAVMGGLASLGLLVGRGKGRLLSATAGAGAGAWLSHPHTLQALYNGELPAVAESVDSARISEFVLKSGEYFDSIISSIRRQTQQNLAEDKPKITKESSLVFVKSSELQTDSDGFKGDQGMSREEDKDLYATRT